MKYDLTPIPNSEISRIIDEWIRSERNRKILKRRLIDGVCYDALSEEFEMSPVQIKRIIYKCEDVLFSHISFE